MPDPKIESMSACYICGDVLNRRTSSKEHILINACGGRLKSFRLLCKVCNERTGADFDLELARQISPLAERFDIKRDRKKLVLARDKIDGPIDDNAANKSIVKTAISFFIMKGGDRKFIHHLIPFFLNKEKLDIVARHIPGISSYSDTPEEVSHIIKLVGCPSEKILYCYIGLFARQGYIVRLNDHYGGPSMDETYIYDVLQSREIKREFDINYSRGELFSFFPLHKLK